MSAETRTAVNPSAQQGIGAVSGPVPRIMRRARNARPRWLAVAGAACRA